MRENSLSDAIAGIAAQIAAALVGGHSTAELRHELSALEQRRRREAAAAEREARAAAEAEQAQQQAAAAALVVAAEDRVRRLLAPLEPPAPLIVRRFPDGHHEIIEE